MYVLQIKLSLSLSLSFSLIRMGDSNPSFKNGKLQIYTATKCVVISNTPLTLQSIYSVGMDVEISLKKLFEIQEHFSSVPFRHLLHPALSLQSPIPNLVLILNMLNV